MISYDQSVLTKFCCFFLPQSFRMTHKMYRIATNIVERSIQILIF